MKERTSYTITIYRTVYVGLNEQVKAVATAVIDPSSTRKVKLMEEDSVTLVFNLPNPHGKETLYQPLIGDYIDDPVFGRFYTTEEHSGEYRTATDSYYYKIRFDAEYIGWKNRLFLLVHDSIDSEGIVTKVRKECVWYLTAKLSAQLDCIIDNLDALGYSNYSYDIDSSTIDTPEQVEFMTYSSVSIFDALTQIADKWECEWWVTDEEENKQTVHKIHFGKCEGDNAVVDFECGVNMKQCAIQSDRKKYFNKLYAFGGTKNLPYSYRRKVKVIVSEKGTVAGDASPARTYFKISPQLTLDMFEQKSLTCTIPERRQWCCTKDVAHGKTTYYIDSDKITIEDGRAYNVTIPTYDIGDVGINGTYNSLSKVTVNVLLCKSDMSDAIQFFDETEQVILNLSSVPFAGHGYKLLVTLPRKTKLINFDTDTKGSYTREYFFRIKFDLTYIYEEEIYFENLTSLSSDYTSLLQTSKVSGSKKLSVSWLDGNKKKHTSTLMTNPLNVSKYDEEKGEKYYYNFFKWDGSSWGYGKDETTVKVGTVLTLEEFGDYVPYAYYTEDFDDPSSLLRIGETRLMMPLLYAPQGYIKPIIEHNDEVEATAVFDDIYPEAIFYVKEVGYEEKTETQEIEGEEEDVEFTYRQYWVTLRDKKFNDIEFDTSFQLPDETLCLKFLSAKDVNRDEDSSKYLLQGMEFEVSFDEPTQTYTLVRNETYGAKLPNLQLLPQAGDPVTFIGCNTRLLYGNDSVLEDAEYRLWEKAEDYLNAVTHNQYTFTCTMMNMFLYERIMEEDSDCVLVDKYGNVMCDKNGNVIYLNDTGNIGLYDKYGRRFYTKDGVAFNLLGGSNKLPGFVPLGYRVNIVNDAMNEGGRTSRVIGYELKLDKPYDSPIYTVGDTQAYSRLAKIEKEISNIN